MSHTLLHEVAGPYGDGLHVQMTPGGELLP
jgi:hypothetical protein